MTAPLPMLAVIAARGGSRGVPLKNIVPVQGRPALAHTADHLRAARRIARAVVSTDDSRIAKVARAEGLEVVDRPPELATDAARLDHVLRHVVEQEKERPFAVLLLYGAVPVRPADYLDRLVETLLHTGCDSVRSVTPAGERHPLWSVRLGDEGRIIEHHGKLNVFRRQDLPPVYFYTGAGLIVRTDTLMAARADDADNFAWLGADQRGLVHEPNECIEIHEPIDIELAEFLLARAAKRARDG